jgi:putative ABC transport system substrate-binding protein
MLAIAAAWASAAGAQAGREAVRIGYLAAGPRECPATPAARALEGALRQALAPREVELLRRCHAAAHQLTQQIAELIARPVDALVAVGPTAARAARGAAGPVPVVFTGVPDPVQAGLVADLAKPGGTVTGVALDPPASASAERLAVLKEAIPGLTRVGVLWSSEYPGGFASLKAQEQAATRLGLKLNAFDLRTPRDVDRALDILGRDGSGAVTVGPGPIAHGSRRELVELAARHRLPAIYHSRLFVEAGGLMSYGPDPTDALSRAAGQVQKIVAGTRAGDLPVEAPTALQLVVSQKTAAALGLTLPPALLRRAAEVLRE